MENNLFSYHLKKKINKKNLYYQLDLTTPGSSPLCALCLN